MHRRTSRLLALACAIPLALTACGSPDEASGPDQPGTSSSAPTSSEDDDMITGGSPIEPTQPEPTSPQITGEVPPSIIEGERVQDAIADMAQRRDVDAAEVAVIGYADVVWRDGSIGCPQEGMMYTQALVPGHLLVLSAAGHQDRYHAAEGKEFTFCANPQDPAPGQYPTMTM